MPSRRPVSCRIAGHKPADQVLTAPASGAYVVQQAVIQTIKDLQRDQGFTGVLISHDLGMVLEATDRVMVMYAGRIIEDSPLQTWRADCTTPTPRPCWTATPIPARTRSSSAASLAPRLTCRSARVVTDEILVLHQGKVVERGPTRQVLQHPRHSYTIRLLDAVAAPFAAANSGTTSRGRRDT
jgi:ABC-type dipeptide/oligopeptide/nickel transport system ATPase component